MGCARHTKEPMADDLKEKTNKMTKLNQQVYSYFEKYDKNATIALRNGEKFIVAAPGTGITEYAFADKHGGDIAIISSVLQNKKQMNAVIMSSQNYTTVVSQTAATMPPLLDDLAQIVGPSVRCAKSKNAFSILRAIAGRHGCFIKNSGALAVGRTLDEADTTTLVLEKGSKAFIESAMIGGAKPIKKVEAVLMHIFYKKKYSKLDQETKLKEMQR